MRKRALSLVEVSRRHNQLLEAERVQDTAVCLSRGPSLLSMGKEVAAYASEADHDSKRSRSPREATLAGDALTEGDEQE